RRTRRGGAGRAAGGGNASRGGGGSPTQSGAGPPGPRRGGTRLGFEFERLKSVRDAKKASYALVLTRLEQARTSEAMDQAGLTNVQIVDHAAVPDKPLPNNRLLTLAIGFVGAMVVGAGGAFGLDSLYTT